MVMSSYMEHGGSGAAWDAMTMIAAPPGTSLGDLSAQGMFAEIAQTLGLQPAGIYTPWATRDGDVSWEEIRNPDTNIVLFSITDAQINQAAQVTFGSPLPFVAVLTRGPMTLQAVASMWSGTAYRSYETQAVYRQDDAKEPPAIQFLHWGERIDIAELPKPTLALGPRVAQVGGSLVFAAQIPSSGSTTRTSPAIPFQSALDSQLVVTAQPAPAPAPTPTDLTTPAVVGEKVNLAVPIAVGLGGALLGYMLWRKRK